MKASGQVERADLLETHSGKAVFSMTPSHSGKAVFSMTPSFENASFPFKVYLDDSVASLKSAFGNVEGVKSFGLSGSSSNMSGIVLQPKKSAAVILNMTFDGDYDYTTSFFNDDVCSGAGLIIFEDVPIWSWGLLKGRIALQVNCGFVGLYGQTEIRLNYMTRALQVNKWYTLHIRHEASKGTTSAYLHVGRNALHIMPVVSLGPIHDVLEHPHRVAISVERLHQTSSQRLEDDVSDMTYFSGMSVSSIPETSGDTHTPISVSGSQSSNESSNALVYSLVSVFGFLAIVLVAFLLYRKFSTSSKQADCLCMSSVTIACPDSNAVVEVVENPLSQAESM